MKAPRRDVVAACGIGHIAANHIQAMPLLSGTVQEQGVQLGMMVLDGTNVRAHQKAAGPPKGGTGAERDAREALGRSTGSDRVRAMVALRGGYGTMACVIADGRGRAIAFRLAPGQAHELPHTVPLLDQLPGVPKWVVGDSGFTTHAFREYRPHNGRNYRMLNVIDEFTHEYLAKRYHYDSHAQLRAHLSDFVSAYNFGHCLKTLRGLTP